MIHIIPAYKAVVSVAVRKVVVVAGKVGEIASGLADELCSIIATTSVIHCMSFGASRGRVLERDDSVDLSLLGSGTALSSSDISNIIYNRKQ